MTGEASYGDMARDPRRRARAWVRWIRVGLALSLLLAPKPALPQPAPQAVKPTEYEVEAAYLSNFGRFVEWPQRPAGNNDSFNVCVYGQDPFGPMLDASLRGENMGGVPMAVRRLQTLEEVAGCRILFISRSKDAQLAATLDSLRNAAVLTVSDIPGFTRRGGMIEFVLDGNRVRFEINIAAARRAGMGLSSQLLKLAVAVRRSP